MRVRISGTRLRGWLVSKPRRYKYGDTFDCGGFHIEVVEGIKGYRADDGIDNKVIVWTDGKLSISMEFVFRFLDIICENEAHLYPKPWQEGRMRLVNECARAVIQGADTAIEKLRKERTERREKDDSP